MQASDLRRRRFFVDLTDKSPGKQRHTNCLRKLSIIILEDRNPSLSGHNLENRAFGLFDLGHSRLLSLCTHTTVSTARLPILQPTISCSICPERVWPCVLCRRFSTLMLDLTEKSGRSAASL